MTQHTTSTTSPDVKKKDNVGVIPPEEAGHEALVHRYQSEEAGQGNKGKELPDLVPLPLDFLLVLYFIKIGHSRPPDGREGEDDRKDNIDELVRREGNRSQGRNSGKEKAGGDDDIVEVIARSPDAEGLTGNTSRVRNTGAERRFSRIQVHFDRTIY